MDLIKALLMVTGHCLWARPSCHKYQCLHGAWRDILNQIQDVWENLTPRFASLRCIMMYLFLQVRCYYACMPQTVCMLHGCLCVCVCVCVCVLFYVVACNNHPLHPAPVKDFFSSVKAFVTFLWFNHVVCSSQLHEKQSLHFLFCKTPHDM